MGNVDSSYRAGLPPKIKDRVCMCPSAAPTKPNWGWQYPETRTGYWIHLQCGKPNHHHCVWECDDCDTWFVPKKPLKYPDFLIEVLCDSCGGR
jgi:hypothetical protein